MRRFSFRPPLTLRGREFRGPRGWSGKPMHPPLTDVPVGAYVLAPAFDVISFVGRDPGMVVLVPSVAVAGLTCLGGTIGGSLAYDYGFNVETAGDSPAWRRSERDLGPGEHPVEPGDEPDVGAVDAPTDLPR
jgi:hypothetical protein